MSTPKSRRMCVVAECPTNRLPETERGHLFCFPTSAVQRKEWLAKLKREDLRDKSYTYLKNHAVCKLHFSLHQFTTSELKKLNTAVSEDPPQPRSPVKRRSEDPIPFPLVRTPKKKFRANFSAASTSSAETIPIGAWLRAASPHLDGRIVGGEPANIEDLPYQLSLQSWGSHICGASIISANWAITAAHCVDGSSASRISLRAGTSRRGSGGSVHNAAQIITHSSYNSRTTDYDYALIKVSTPFPLGRAGVQAIQLTDSEPGAGTMATASGWGTLSSGGSSPIQLQRVAVPIIARATCRDKYRGYDITARMICAGLSQGGKDSCQGDSGGPLAAGGRLVGIVSWGLGCASPNYPGVYTNVAAQRAWIKQNTGV